MFQKNFGQPVYSQVIKLLDKAKIQQISLETLGSERYVKRLTGWKHLIIMLFGVLKHFDSLRELEIGMKAETMKLSHLGLDYVVRRSTLAEANQRRAQEFFAKVYASLLERYTPFLPDSRSVSCQKAWEKQLYMMDSTTITLFAHILKGVGRHPKSGKKKGGMKVHTIMKYQVGVPMVVELTSAAQHDHYLLKKVHLPQEATLAIGSLPDNNSSLEVFFFLLVRKLAEFIRVRTSTNLILPDVSPSTHFLDSLFTCFPTRDGRLLEESHTFLPSDFTIIEATIAIS